MPLQDVVMVLPPDVTASVAVFSPVVVYVLFAEEVAPESESVPLHKYEYPAVPPVTAEVQETGCKTVTGFGLAEQVTVNTFTVRVFESVAVPPGPVHEIE